MEHHVETTLRVHASAEKVWATIADFSSVERYSAKVESSPLIGDKAGGLGAKRKCTFYDKSTVVEEIVEFHDGESLRIELSEYSMPLTSMVAQMKVSSVDASHCDVYFGMDYVVKFGPLGWVMGRFMMKPMMKGVTKNVLRGLAYNVVTGKSIGSDFPSDAEIAPALS